MERALQENRKVNIIFIIAIITMICLCGFFVFIALNPGGNYTLSQNEITLEAGTDFDPYDYITVKETVSASAVLASGNVNTAVPGIYTVEYSEKGKNVKKLNVTVVDTIAPVVTVSDSPKLFTTDQVINTSDLIETCDDATEVTISMNYADIDTTTPGEYTVNVYITDLGGNTTTVMPLIKIEMPDYEAPVISGADDIMVNAGTALDYTSAVTVTDNLDENPVLTVDYKDLDINVEGDYEITYTATDFAGNTSEKSCIVTVVGNAYQTGTTSGGSASNQILGLTQVNLFVGTSFDPMAGVSLSAEFAPDQTINYDIGTFDSNKTGTYKILYAAVNLNNELVVAERTVVVRPQPFYYKPDGCTYSFDAAGIAGQPYIVLVNRAMCCVTVYEKDADGNYTVPVKAFACSIGREGHETPTGRFTTSGRYDWCYMVDGSWGRNAITVYRGIMFHTVCYYTKSTDDLEYDEFNKLGSPASLGCIRLCYADETWLYENCPTGFTTIIYDDYASPGPLGKPEPVKIDTTDEQARGWDPTDPENPYIDSVSANNAAEEL